MHTHRIQIDLPGRDSGQLAALMAALTAVMNGPHGDAQARITPLPLATPEQIAEARDETGGNIDDDAAISYLEDDSPGESDHYWIQAWVRVVGGQHPVTLGRVKYALEDIGHTAEPGFAERLLAHILAEHGAGTMLPTETLIEAAEQMVEREAPQEEDEDA